MIIYEVNNGDLANQNYTVTSGSNFIIFRANCFKLNFWNSLKRRQHNVLFVFIKRHSPDIMNVWLWGTERRQESWHYPTLRENTRLESPKNIHYAMKPITIQLECPYNSSNETTKQNIPMYEFLRFHCTSIESVIQQSVATVFHSVNRVSQWFSGPFRWPTVTQCAY